MLEQKFVIWLRKQATESGHGEKTEIAEATGLSRSYVSRLLSKNRRGAARLGLLEQIAQHRGCRPSQVLWMIEEGVSDLPPRETRRRR